MRKIGIFLQLNNVCRRLNTFKSDSVQAASDTNNTVVKTHPMSLEIGIDIMNAKINVIPCAYTPHRVYIH